WRGLMQNPFLVFLVSEKLDAKLSDNLLKKHFFYRGIKLWIAGERIISKHFLYPQENKIKL
ncbi:hypothetical protein ACLGC1_00005, partial [Helicobacter pylori]